MLEAVRRATRVAHVRLEARLAILDGTLTRDRYRDLIAAHFGYLAAIEPQLPAPLRARGLDVDARRKVPALLDDLRALGLDAAAIDALPRCHALPRVAPDDGGASALGVAYVLEGSTLGGRVLSRHFAAALAIDATNGGRFFAGYGERTRERWRAFVDVLARSEREHESAIVDAAVETFATLEAWLEERGLLR